MIIDNTDIGALAEREGLNMELVVEAIVTDLINYRYQDPDESNPNLKYIERLGEAFRSLTDHMEALNKEDGVPNIRMGNWFKENRKSKSAPSRKAGKHYYRLEAEYEIERITGISMDETKR